MRGHVWVGLVLLAACGTKTSAAPTKTFELDGVRATVPASWVPSPPQELDRLRASGLRGDPNASMEVVAAGVPGGRMSDLALIVFHYSPERSRAATVREGIEEALHAAKANASAKGRPVEGSFECRGRQCTWRLVYPEIHFGTRAVAWSVNGLTIEHTCTASDLTVLDGCVLPDAPANAESVGDSISTQL
jgi:hypothetical protein